MKKSKKEIIVLIICCALLVAVGVGYLVVNKLNASKKVAEEQYFGGDIKAKPKWQTTPDNTNKLQPIIEKEFKEKYDLVLEPMDAPTGIKVYIVRVTNAGKLDELVKSLQKEYVKYRDQGYKAGWHIYLNDDYKQSFPPMRVD